MRAAPNLGADYQEQFDAIYPDLAARYGVALYPFFLDGVAADPKLNQKDGLHPNARAASKSSSPVCCRRSRRCCGR